MKQFHINLPDELYEKIVRMAEEKEVTMSDVVREGLTVYFDNSGRGYADVVKEIASLLTASRSQ